MSEADSNQPMDQEQVSEPSIGKAKPAKNKKNEKL